MPKTATKHRGIFPSIIIALSSLIAPGMGHVFGGRLLRGLLLALIMPIVIFFSSISGAMHNVWSALTIYFIMILWFIGLVVDAYLLNHRKAGIKLKWYNRSGVSGPLHHDSYWCLSGCRYLENSHQNSGSGVL